jgi:hypothetical protein
LETEEVEVDLTLGLSLGGWFGPDRSRLPRSSSVACIRAPEEEALAPPAALARTNSLPFARLPPSSDGDAPAASPRLALAWDASGQLGGLRRHGYLGRE